MLMIYVVRIFSDSPICSFVHLFPLAPKLFHIGPSPLMLGRRLPEHIVVDVSGSEFEYNTHCRIALLTIIHDAVVYDFIS